MSPEPRDSYIVIPTFGLYPSGALIEAYVIPGTASVQVSDGGGAYEELVRAGEPDEKAMASLVRFGRRKGFSVDTRGWITSQPIEASLVTSFVALIAEVSRSAADFLLNRFKPKAMTDYRTDVDQELRLMFNEQLTRNARVRGTEKFHKFDYKIQLPGEKQLLLDLVVPDPNSINSAVVSHLDVKHRGDRKILQSIVYNPEDGWRSEDIALLSMAIPPLRVSALKQHLEKLAA